MKRATHLSRIAGFAAVPLFSMFATLALLPIISHTFGPDGWSAVILGQTLGAFASVVAGLAWQVTGAHIIASSSAAERRVLFAESITSRAVMLVLLLPAALALALLLIDIYRVETCLFLTATSLNCFNASWYFAGTGQPKMVVINEGLVRLSAYALSVPLVLYTQQLWVYSMCLLLGGVVMATANACAIFSGHPLPKFSSLRSPFVLIKSHLSGMTARTIQSGQQYLGVPFVAAFAPPVLPLFAALDALQKAAINATAFYPQAFAWWVANDKSCSGANRRIRRLAHLTGIIAICGLVVWSFFGTALTALLFSGEVEPSRFLNFWNGLAIAGFSALRALGLLGLIPLNKSSLYYKLSASTALAAAALFVLGLLLISLQASMAGAAIAYSTTSIGVYIYILRASKFE